MSQHSRFRTIATGGLKAGSSKSKGSREKWRQRTRCKLGAIFPMRPKPVFFFIHFIHLIRQIRRVGQVGWCLVWSGGLQIQNSDSTVSKGKV